VLILEIPPQRIEQTAKDEQSITNDEMLSDEKLVQVDEVKISDENKCIRCGRDSHTIQKCYAKTDTKGNKLDSGTKKTEIKKSSNNKNLANADRKYIRFYKNGKWFSIPNKNYLPKKSYVPKSVDNNATSYATYCTIF